MKQKLIINKELWPPATVCSEARATVVWLFRVLKTKNIDLLSERSLTRVIKVLEGGFITAYEAVKLERSKPSKRGIIQWQDFMYSSALQYFWTDFDRRKLNTDIVNLIARAINWLPPAYKRKNLQAWNNFQNALDMISTYDNMNDSPKLLAKRILYLYNKEVKNEKDRN